MNCYYIFDEIAGKVLISHRRLAAIVGSFFINFKFKTWKIQILLKNYYMIIKK